MARIPDDEIERLKTEVSLVRLVESSGVELKKQGKDLVGRCPYHDDREPSLVVSESKNLWHCLGACNTGGTVIDWTMKMQGVSFRHAVELLRNGNPALAAKEKSAPRPVKHGTTAKLPSGLSAEADDARLLQRVVSYYHQTLKQSPEAQDYLKSRGLANAELIDAFQLGYANRTLGYRLPEKNRAEGSALRGRLQALGILRSSGHEHLNGSLVIPLFDEGGNVVQLYGRKLLDNLRAGTPKHLYLPRPHAGVFNRTGITGAREVILCEALIDALSFWAAGYRNVTAAFGVNGLTDELLAFLAAQKVQRVLIAYDRDEAGDRGAQEAAERLMAAGIEAFRIVFPHGLDANAYACKVQPAAKSLGVAIRGAQWLGKGRGGAGEHPVDARPAERPAMDGRAGPEREAGTAQRSGKPAIESAPHLVELAPPPAAMEPPPAPKPVLAAAVPAPPAPELPPPSQASPIPDGPSAEAVPIEVRPHEILVLLGDRRWRVRGLAADPGPVLKLNLLVSRGDTFHVDTLDLYQPRLRDAYARQAAAELAYPEEALKRDLCTLVLKLEAHQAENLKRAAATPQPIISDADKAAALDLLRDPRLVERIRTDLTACGIVGEDVNKLVAYLACVSRKQHKPLAVVIQSTSAAGKSALMDAVLELVPEEDRVQYSAMTGQSVYYLGELELQHKILAVAEEQGMQDAAYPLKLLLSQGQISIASTGKNAASGMLETHHYKVRGPVMLFVTTTSTTLDPELENRCLVLTVNETREQTQAIHRLQRSRRTLEGLLARRQGSRIATLHQNAQRLLRALPVVNPYAERLSFADAATRTRRDHEKYLSLIEAVALLHQYQRPVQSREQDGETIEYLEVQPSDIALANQLARVVLGQSLDELPPQTRRLLHLIEGLVAERLRGSMLKRPDVRFSRRDVREHTQWGQTQLRVHLDRLVEMEYLVVHRGRQGAGFVYELAYDGQGQDGGAFLPGLIDVEMPATATSRGSGSDLAGRVRAGSGPVAGGPPQGAKPHADSVSDEEAADPPKRTSGRANGADHSRNHPLPLVARKG
jgi:DNA primase catalytic core